MLRLLILIPLLFLLLACGEDTTDPLLRFDGPTMGTRFNITYLPGPDTPIQVEIETRVVTALEEINQLMSTYIPDSELNRFNNAVPNEDFRLSPKTFEVIELAQTISAMTEGAFDISVSGLVDLWGFGPNMQPMQVPDEASVALQLAQTGYTNLMLNEAQQTLVKQAPLTVDLSAIAKGYAVDVIAEYLDSLGVGAYLVEIGGEIRAKGRKPGDMPWRIAVESPTPGKRSIQKIIALTDTGVATSGDYRNYFEEEGIRYSHMLDPRTGYPIRHRLASVTVLDERCAKADALATALMVMGPEQGFDFAEFHKLPVLFIIKSAAGFEERASSAMLSYLSSHK